MSLIAVGSAKGAPGVTTLVTALAAVWPELAVLADCDPAGGDVALRLRAGDGGWLARDRGLVGLAASTRVRAREDDADRDSAHVAEQVQHAVGGLPVLVGVDSPAQARAMSDLWPGIAQSLAAPITVRVTATAADHESADVVADVVADCGRVGPGLSSDHLLAVADVVVLVAAAGLEGTAHVRHALDHVNTLRHPRRATDSVWVAVVGPVEAARRDVAELTSALHGIAVNAGAPNEAAADRHGRARVRGIAWDPRAAAGLSGAPSKGLDRSALIASARRLASDLHTQLATSRSTSSQSASSRSAPSVSTVGAATPPELLPWVERTDRVPDRADDVRADIGAGVDARTDAGVG